MKTESRSEGNIIETEKKITRLGSVMLLFGVPAKQLSGLCGVSGSLVSRWQKGTRPLTAHSVSIRALSEALLSLDETGQLEEKLAPWRVSGESMTEALCLYLTGEPLPALPERAQPQEIQRGGSYVVQQQILLGVKGFNRGMLLMLDYLLRLPPNRRVIICAHGGFDLWHGSLPFALQFLHKLNGAVKRGTAFTLINRDTPDVEGSPYFSVFWIASHLKGTIRSRHYKGESPAEYFVSVIPGYWSGWVETDDTAEDGLIGTICTDARGIRRSEAHCEEYLRKSTPGSQYGFLRRPLGDGENEQRWQPGPLPAYNAPNAALPSGCFSAVCRTPSFGIMTREEFARILGKDAPPPAPDYLFSSDGKFAPGPHRIILCREDVREGLLKTRKRSDPLSRLLGRSAYIPRAMLAGQLKRLLAAMEQNESFEVALMPKSAFAKLEIELVHWHGSASVGWLQDGSESMFDDNPAISASFFSAVNYTWGRLHKGWKSRRFVMPLLRKWLSGKDLELEEKDSAIVQNWDVLPKG